MIGFINRMFLQLLQTYQPVTLTGFFFNGEELSEVRYMYPYMLLDTYVIIHGVTSDGV